MPLSSSQADPSWPNASTSLMHNACMICCACAQGLKEFPSIVIVPMMQISWTLFSVLSGGIYFKEYRTFTAGSGFMFTLGVLVGALPWSAISPITFSQARSVAKFEVACLLSLLNTLCVSGHGRRACWAVHEQVVIASIHAVQGAWTAWP